MKIVEMLTKRIQDRKEAVNDEQAALWQEYRDLILHDGELPGPELERLAALMETLGIDDPGEVEFHRAVLAKFERAKDKHEKEAPRLLAESVKLDSEANEIRREILKLQGKLSQVNNQAGLASGEYHQCIGQGEQAANLKALFGGLLPGPSLPVRLDDRIGPDGELVELRQRLGLPPIESKLGRDLQPGKVKAAMRPITFDKR